MVMAILNSLTEVHWPNKGLMRQLIRRPSYRFTGCPNHRLSFDARLSCIFYRGLSSHDSTHHEIDHRLSFFCFFNALM